MTLVELVTLFLLTTQPFGGIPFTATASDDQVSVVILKEPPIQLMFNSDLEVTEANHVKIECTPDTEI
jgi:hypothetical protein